VDISADQSTSWTTPTVLQRCPLHNAFQISDYQTFGTSLVPPGGGKFSVAQREFPDAAKNILNESTGLIIRYTSPAGASEVSLWRVRVNSATDQTVRFVTLFSIPADGVVDETRYLPWTSFFGQIVERGNPKVLDCREINDTRCNMTPGNLTHVSFLESEDTIAHEILLHQLIVTTDPIAEQNVTQHHTAEAEALLWEREHAALNPLQFTFNGTQWQVGGNCSGIFGACTYTTTTTTAAPPRVVTVTVTRTVLVAVAASGAPIEATCNFCVVVFTILCSAWRGH
jgi:hypothetical protein